MLQRPAAFLLPPDPGLAKHHQQFLEELSPRSREALPAMLTENSFRALYRLQQKQFGKSPKESRSLPLWFRSTRGSNLLAVVLLTVTDGYAEASVTWSSGMTSKAVNEEVIFLWQDLIHALCSKAALGELQALHILNFPQELVDINWESYIPQGVLYNLSDPRAHSYRSFELHFPPGFAKTNGYAHTAPFYESDLHARSLQDIPFYLRQCQLAASRENSRILELACGSGRITLPLLAAGHHLVAMDHSPALLAGLKRYSQLYPAAQRRRLRIYEHDITDFDLNTQFEIVLIPFRSLQLVQFTPGTAAVASCLAAVKRHLAPGGRLIFDITHPDEAQISRFVQPETLSWQRLDPVDGTTLVRKDACDYVDLTHKLMRHTIAFEETKSDGSWSRFEDMLKYRYFPHWEIKQLLAETGFTLRAAYGNFAGAPVGEGQEQVLIAEVTSQS
ncbi:MAG: methyltransferase domain-containing protein [Symbiobacteriaceae bacterium]|nr:methyltransferase domain-containing protein [Symbiobacteriaceae bacterium]